MTALNELIEIIKQKRKESEISNTLLKFVQIEAEKLLETEKEQQDEFAIGFGEWLEILSNADYGTSEYDMYQKWDVTTLLKIYKKEKGL